MSETRSVPSTWNAAEHRAQRAKHPALRAPLLNVGEYERWASVLGGGTLALYGLTRGSWRGLALAALGGMLVQRGVSGHCTCYTALGINTAHRPHGPMASVTAGHGVKVEKTITVQRSPEELYRLWHNFENLPRFMSHLESVKMLDPRHSHWVARGPLGTRVEWDAETHTDRANELISWRSLEGANVDTAGSVHFTKEQDGTGTHVRVVLKYNPPGEKLGVALAKILGEAPEQEVEKDLQHFKEQVEAGAIPLMEERSSEMKTGRQTCEPMPSERKGHTDPVQEASEESFPASDPPGWIGRCQP
jgi:uncharacterized membrane protein